MKYKLILSLSCQGFHANKLTVRCGGLQRCEALVERILVCTPSCLNGAYFSSCAFRIERCLSSTHFSIGHKAVISSCQNLSAVVGLPVGKHAKMNFSSCQRTYCENKDSDSDRKLSLLNSIVMDAKSTNSSEQKEGKRIPLFEEEEEEDITLERQLMRLMRVWKTDEAITLLKDSVAEGKNPDRTVVFNMMLQIAELGKVDCLMQLRGTECVERGIVSKVHLYKCCCLALRNSGRILDGIDSLREEFLAGHSMDDINAFFTILGTMIIKDFPHYYPMVEEFVSLMITHDPPVPTARALLWKCHVLSESFDKAARLKDQHMELKKMIPAQVTAIIQSTSHIEYDRDAVFVWLMKQPEVKEGLRGTILHILIQNKCDEKAWSEAVDHILSAMDNGIKIHAATMENFLTQFLEQFSEQDLKFLETLVDSAQRVEIKEKQGEGSDSGTGADAGNNDIEK